MLDRLKEVGDSIRESASKVEVPVVDRSKLEQMGSNLRASTSKLRDNVAASANLENLREGTSKLRDSASSQLSALGKTGQSLRESVGTAGQALKENAGAAGKSLKESAGAAGKSLKDGAGAAGNSIREAADKSGLKESIGSLDIETGDGGGGAQQGENEVCAMFPSLSWKQRVTGCLSCMVIGYIISLGSFFRLEALLLGNPVPFVATATIGNIVSLCGSCFLMGPTSQAKKMFHKTRRLATFLYLGFLTSTLLVAFLAKGMPGQGPALLMLMLCQYAAIAWYCLSYIPFARQITRRMFNRIYSRVLNDEI